MGSAEGVARDPHDVESIRFAAIDPGFAVQAVEASQTFDRAREASIAAHWRAACAASGSPLHDGPVLCLAEANRRQLVGRLWRRRDVVAGRADASLFDGQPPEPVSVGSLVTSHGRVLLGHRRGLAPTAPGAWGLVAREELDDAFLERRTRQLDYRGALLARLVECAPLARPARNRLVPFALAHDVDAGAWHLCLAFELDPNAQTCADVEGAESPEFDAFRFVRPVDVIESGPYGADELDALTAALVRLPRADVSVA